MPPFSVAVPTIGRVALLECCLRSIAVTRPAPNDILVLDQSGDTERLAAALGALDIPGLRVLPCLGRGIASNMNLALREASCDILFVTHDDCSVDPDWSAHGLAAYGSLGGVVTGSVWPPPGVDPDAVPSTKTAMQPECFTGRRLYGVLYPNNMVLDRRHALAIGGFDERAGFRLAAEDLDFSYRWLKSGAAMNYRPEMRVIHHDWRGPAELVTVYRRYARAAGEFYAKHLLEGDWQMLRWILMDLRLAARSRLQRRTDGERAVDERRFLFPHMPIGVLTGLGRSMLQRSADR